MKNLQFLSGGESYVTDINIAQNDENQTVAQVKVVYEDGETGVFPVYDINRPVDVLNFLEEPIESLVNEKVEFKYNDPKDLSIRTVTGYVIQVVDNYVWVRCQDDVLNDVKVDKFIVKMVNS